MLKSHLKAFLHTSLILFNSPSRFNELKRGVDFGYQQNGALVMSKDLKEDERAARCKSTNYLHIFSQEFAILIDISLKVEGIAKGIN